MEICNTACDNHAANNELCAKNIKVCKKYLTDPEETNSAGSS